MAIPRVFISSTCYDLKYIRGNLQYFVKNLGYEPVLSEQGDVFYDPDKHTQDSCLSEVSTCQMFVLIIGGRFGGKYKETDKSITNAEYDEAVNCKIPVFTLVEQSVHAEHHVYLKNKANSAIDATKIHYPAVDNTKIFDFIDQVRRASYNNAVQPFLDFSDIESYLKKQWAGLMFSFLSTRHEENRVLDVVSQIARVNDRVEFLSSQLLQSVGTEEAKLLSRLYDIMLSYECTRVLLGTKHKPKPTDVLRYSTLEQCASAIGPPLQAVESADFSWSGSGEVDAEYLKRFAKDYEKMRADLIEAVKEAGLKPEDLIEGE